MEMRAYSQDLRDRVLRGLERGERPVDIARRLEVSRMWVYQVRARLEREGSRESLRQGGYRVSRIAPMKEEILGWIDGQMDLTLKEIRGRLLERGVDLKESALWRQLNKWGLRFKINAARQRARERRRAAEAGSLDAGAAVSGGEVAEIR
jgi:transposase